MTTHPTPAWLDRIAYPFEARFFQAPAGAMHYVDEGQGRPVVFVHGNPSWSFEFRKVIARLKETRRCVAVDHLGFGLSDKPQGFSYLPEDQAKNFAAFMAQLDLHDVTLVVSDWGGPVGLSWALAHPERVRSVVITNTWLWSVRSDWYYQGFSGFMGGPLGRYLIRRHNFFASTVVPLCFGDRSLLTPALHQQFLSPLGSPEERLGCSIFPKEIIASSDWLEGLWAQREVLKHKRLLLAWGMKDIAFREKELDRWRAAYPQAKTVRYEGCGHWVAEERPAELADEVTRLDLDAKA
jgi:haloalkane dehalogenase